MIIAINADKVFDMSQHLLIIKTLNKIRIERTFLYIRTVIYNTFVANSIVKELNLFPMKSVTVQRCPFSHYLM